ncbi:MAG: RNA 2',3'-cyclic phosphodiesterase [Oscillospiraceae bacterium]|nr:RNA 2',3'-cyclic phosphodiesterase [Oscillospiraceae bacterium]
MRLFIAVELPASVRAAIAQSAGRLREAFPRGRFSRGENYHLTLAFLGETPEARLSDVTAAMDCCRAQPFALTVGAVGTFPGGVLWRAVDGGDDLTRLQRLLTAALCGRGFRLEQRGYKPHLTLAREAVRDPRVPLPDLPPLTCTADHMTLFRSDRIDGKLVYTPLHRTKFA